MKISIITVTKNNKKGLLRAIECVSNQTYKNVEHIIVDGGSMDGTKEKMEDGRWKKDSIKFFSEPDEGIYDAINKGIKLATGDVIGLLHSDDLYADEKVLERYVEIFESDSRQAGMTTQPGMTAQAGRTKQIDLVYSDLVYVRRKSDSGQAGMTTQTGMTSQSTTENQLSTTCITIRYWKTQKKEFTTEAQRHRTLKNGWMPPHPTLFIRKELFDKYGLYRTDMKIAADYEMILRLFYKYKITSYYLPITTYLLTIGGESNKSIGNIFLKSKEDYNAMKLNEIPLPFYTLLLKNFRKLPQFLAR
jgi:glycosyltransferase involved in cell wall biosynthesis